MDREPLPQKPAGQLPVFLKKYIDNYFKEVGLKYLSQKIHNDIIKFMKENSDILSRETIVHECIHLLDDLRRKPTYRSKEQTFNSVNDFGGYYNSPKEMNAYYQETVSKFKGWIKDKTFSYKDFKKFDDYFDEFMRHGASAATVGAARLSFFQI